jgi:Recombinase zinc beta ribbon domain
MGTLACLLGVLAAGLGCVCWLLFIEMERRGVEIAQVRQQLDRYLHDDQRMVDALWNPGADRGGPRDAAGQLWQRQHNHYLKGMLWCGRCGRRMVVIPGRGNGGTYFYYLCRGRQEHVCDQPYVRIEKVEDLVTRHFATVALSEEFCARVRVLVEDATLSELGSLTP